MEKCFEFVIHIYDGNGKKRYYGNGELVATESSIEGYVCNDYLLIEPVQKDSYNFLFYNSDTGKLISIQLSDLELEFPGNYIVQDEASKIFLEVGSIIKDFEKCKQIEYTLEKVKSNL